MTLLDEGLKAQKSGTFVIWYHSLSDKDREQFNTELRGSVEKITQAFTEFNNYLQDTLPVVMDKFGEVFKSFVSVFEDK